MNKNKTMLGFLLTFMCCGDGSSKEENRESSSRGKKSKFNFDSTIKKISKSSFQSPLIKEGLSPEELEKANKALKIQFENQKKRSISYLKKLAGKSEEDILNGLHKVITSCFELNGKEKTPSKTPTAQPNTQPADMPPAPANDGSAPPPPADMPATPNNGGTDQPADIANDGAAPPPPPPLKRSQSTGDLDKVGENNNANGGAAPPPPPPPPLERSQSTGDLDKVGKNNNTVKRSLSMADQLAAKAKESAGKREQAIQQLEDPNRQRPAETQPAGGIAAAISNAIARR